jgi:hypothetical protein
MDKINLSRLALWTAEVLFFSQLVFAGSVQAQSTDTVCAAVLPCDAEGNVVAPFNFPDSPCYDTYLSQCAAYQENLEKESALIARIEELESENSLLKNRLRALNRQLRRRFS